MSLPYYPFITSTVIVQSNTLPSMILTQSSTIDSLNLAPYLPNLSDQLRKDLQVAHSNIEGGMVPIDNKPFLVGNK